ncbi:TolC family protein [Geofilum sp. OHC36d9]|uniref:TolC family protein n=1 Tax=Geofilum sp. OHC36d9 TaxID=3458413 RepID=UPI0040333EE6
MKILKALIFLALSGSFFVSAQAQSYSLKDCIEYALENSTDIERSQNNVSIQSAYLEQSKASRLPNLQLGVNQQLSSTSSYNSTDSGWDRSSNSTLNASLTSEIALYNGAKIKNTISQNRINLESAELSIQAEKELISLNILSYYIDVLLARDNLSNSRLQFEATQKQLVYAEARSEAGVISRSDLLYIKSQLASDKTSMIEAESNMRIALVSLMQIMNMPINDSFDIQQPDIEALINQNPEINPEAVYNIALGIQPGIQTAELNVKSAETEVAIVKSGTLPSLKLNTGVGTGYGSNIDNINFGEQFSNNVNPYVGLSLSIPIYQRKQVKTQVKAARIESSNVKLELMDLKNDLRKYIEQACTDAQTAQSSYSALQEQLDAEQESYDVASEMYSQGLINSVDFLLSKNNLIIAENKFTQAKYNLVLQNKIVEYYLGNPIEL